MNHVKCRRKKKELNRLFEMFRKHNKAQDKREEELDRLYKAIDGGE